MLRSAAHPSRPAVVLLLAPLIALLLSLSVVSAAAADDTSEPASSSETSTTPSTTDTEPSAPASPAAESTGSDASDSEAPAAESSDSEAPPVETSDAEAPATEPSEPGDGQKLEDAQGAAADEAGPQIGLLAAVPGEITSEGPLSSIVISADLNCAVQHASDDRGSFFDDTACGTFIAADDVLYGPDDVPAGNRGQTAFSPVSQTAGGAGTTADPYRIDTAVDAGSLRIDQADSYIVGQESYRTSTTITNNGSAAVTLVLYKAADCYLQDSDTGFGAYNPATGAVSCVGAEDDQPTQRIIQFAPISAGSSFIQAGYSTVWNAVATKEPLPNECATCDRQVDNGMGLSWTITIDPGQSVARSHLTTFSPMGTAPLTTAMSADQPTTQAGEVNGYTVAISNPNTLAASLSTITATLPDGFSYIPGSTDGPTNADPVVEGAELTWAADLSVSGGSAIELHFSVRVADEPGTYYAAAAGTAVEQTVLGVDMVAPITVTTPVLPPVEPDPPVDPEPELPVSPEPVVPVDNEPTVPAPAKADNLARTGVDVGVLGAVGAALLAAGITLVLTGRRRSL